MKEPREVSPERLSFVVSDETGKHLLRIHLVRTDVLRTRRSGTEYIVDYVKEVKES